MPCFRESDGSRTDTVVLACTHYPLLLEPFRKIAPWPVTFIDPAPAIARRVVDLTGPRQPEIGNGRSQFVLTSGRTPPEPLRQALAQMGLQ
jgi:glutamate racemase